jgi:hypothetical protein
MAVQHDTEDQQPEIVLFAGRAGEQGPGPAAVAPPAAW